MKLPCGNMLIEVSPGLVLRARGRISRLLLTKCQVPSKSHTWEVQNVNVTIEPKTRHYFTWQCKRCSVEVITEGELP